ncbi:MAG: UPF0104 family protein [Candidatus Abyssobacteria bacterium SURF_17]|jgi:uncharacterized membrane protein YbhN (UPF0104 family)|uniref:UPF0104 family protein n=1 Tax=Candidatus Abyssobacteria bacterium SURF_17 TaxID=2093361 RepID=A0A419EW45_9BACT|nr:MAG: UPF0104 family protein [Candidatus Abyssubacteria bacterium SURF_17]
MRWRRVVSLVLFVLLAAAGVLYYIRHEERFRLITAVSADAIVVLVLLKGALIVCFGYQVKVLTDHYGLNLSFSKWFGLSRMSTFLNLILPFGSGSSLKAVYLQKFHNLKFSSFIASGAIAGLIRVVITTFCAVLLLLSSGQPSTLLLLMAGGLFIGSLSFLLVGHRIDGRFFSFSNGLASLVNEWRPIRTDHAMIGKLVIINSLIFAISCLEVYYSFRAFSIDASLASSGVIAAVTTFTGAMKLVPANLGIKEAVFMALSGFYGTGVNEGLHAAALHRIIGTACTLLLAPGFAYPLSKKVAADKER